MNEDQSKSMKTTESSDNDTQRDNIYVKDTASNNNLRSAASVNDFYNKFNPPYDKCKVLALEKAINIKAKTTTNYVPYQNVILLRGESTIKKSDLLKPKLQDVFEQALGFKFEVVAIGPHVKDIDIGDFIDIKNTKSMSICSFIPDPNTVFEWRIRLRDDREAMIAHNVKSAESPNKVGGPTMVKHIKPDVSPVMFNLEQEVTIVEYFLTEDHNISGIFFPMNNVHKG